MKKLVLDFDSTLVAFTEGMNDWMYAMGYTSNLLTNESVTSYDFHMKNYGEHVRNFWLQDPVNCYEQWVKPYPQSREFIKWCERKFDEVEILTVSCKPETESAKKDFIREHYGFTNVKFCKPHENKYSQTENAILIDDYPHHVLNHCLHNKCHGIVFDYNGSNGWSKLENYHHILSEESIDINKVWVSKTYDLTRYIIAKII